MRAARACVALSVVLGAVTLAAQAPKTDPAPPVSPPRETPIGAAREMTASDVESFLDGLVPSQLDRDDIAGAVIAIVKDGKVLFAKGYGYADTTNKSRVTVDTLFRPGSISKLFTWTAVMQLVEQGKLDLDVDVNRYLDFKIPDTYPQPITMRHMMTHTPGFEEDGRDLIGHDTTTMVPLGRWLVTHIPGRVRPPGTYSSYSNYATALAGYVVERVAGMPFDDYVEQRILAPLGMAQTTSRQPLPAKLAGGMSGGFSWKGGRFEREKFEVVHPAPAGSFASSATDMARFMLAHLGNGAYNGQRVLADSTVALMHRRAFSHDPRI